MTEREELAFLAAVAAAQGGPISEGFNVYNEGLIHKAVKLYIEPNTECHEVHLPHAVADVLSGDTVYEVQTGSPLPLIPKIKALLDEYRVTLVLPFRALTHHVWLDPDSGEASVPKRINARPKPIHTASQSLYAVRELISHPGFSVRILPLAIDEVRLLDGYGRDRRRRATLVSRTPTRLLDDIELSSVDDYKIFIPDTLGDEFTAPEFLRAIKSRSRYDRIALSLLAHLGLIERTGKRGNAYIYRQINTAPNSVNLTSLSR